MIVCNNGTVNIHGNSTDVIAEASTAIMATVETIAEGDADVMGATLYSIFVTACRALKKRNPDLDTEFLYMEIWKEIGGRKE